MILLDTNILARWANHDDPDYSGTLAVVSSCRKRDRGLFVAAQTVQEFWVVATRTVKTNGLGMSPSRVDKFLTHFLRSFPRIDDPPSLFEHWRKLVNAHAITDIHTYDARLAAFAIAAGIQTIMTFNQQDFSIFPVKLIDPKHPHTW